MLVAVTGRPSTATSIHVSVSGGVAAGSGGEVGGSGVGFLTGEPRQGRFGIGWSTLAALQLDVPETAVPELTVRAVDEGLDAIASTTGAGSAAPT